MRLLHRLPKPRLVSKPTLAIVIALVSAGVGVLVEQTKLIGNLNDSVYDPAYDLRRQTNGRSSPVVMVMADEMSLRAMAAIKDQHWGWPWPRQFWGFALLYVQKCGAKAAAVDILFPEPSQYNGELGDDSAFAELLDQLKMPVVFATHVAGESSQSRFAPPVKRPPTFGADNISDGATARDYLGVSHGTPSLALRTVQVTGVTPPDWAHERFRLHYYGHTLDAKGHGTFPTIPAAEVIDASLPDHTKANGFDPSIFKGKIVLFGTSAVGAFDLKSSPLDPIYPGAEIHATAIENLLKYQRVRIVPGGALAAVTALVAAAASAGATAPRRTWMKLLLSMLVAVVLLIVTAILFRGENIVWLPPVGPLAAIGLSVVLALSWSYFAEDRQARFYLRAMGQYLSPQIAAELKADPTKLSISTTKGELTILFSDIVSFTDLSERLEERIGPLLNYYLDEMSAPVLAENGTIDKYIGDAIMSFWNAPLPQPDHAARACRTALAMQRRLTEIQPKLAELDAPGLATRIGINTGLCAYGNMGSRAKFNYSVIGDACNFASRLEGQNKMYGTRILVGDATRNLVHDRFVFRKVDVVRVQGKLKPNAIYELIDEGPADEKKALLIKQYEAAFSHYCRKEWDASEKILLDVLASFPDDGPSRELLSRIALFKEHPPAATWDGVFVAKGK